MKQYDVIIIGAGAAGLSAACAALLNRCSVLILDMGEKPARKILASGGGRCNFTNIAATTDKYHGQNPDFVRSALSKLKPTEILEWMRLHSLEWTEKTPGRFFCSTTGADILSAMLNDTFGAEIILNTIVTDIEKIDNKFTVYTEISIYYGNSVIVATGGVSFPALTVSDFGYKIAKKFGHKIVPLEPGLVALKTDVFSARLSGISLDVEIKIGKEIISDSLLFTHFGIGGPATYRLSLYDLAQGIHINFTPKLKAYEYLTKAKQTDGKKSLSTLMLQYLPMNFAKWLLGSENKNIADYKNTEIMEIARQINNFAISGDKLKRRGFQSAEITIGGISTEFISSKTMESELCRGLYFAGEVLDIAGDLGGFNLHFAFASGKAAGENAGV